jgi:hypothetical protein
MAKRIAIGDVIQINTSEGMAYAQVTHKHSRYGHLLRVFEGVFGSRPNELEEVVSTEVLFSTFFPVQKATSDGLLMVAGNWGVASKNLAFPVFRGSARDKEGSRGPWWLWDGEREVMLTRGLTSEEERYPVRGIISFPLLVERAENGYRAETHDL